MLLNKFKSLQLFIFFISLNFLISAKEFTLTTFIEKLKTTKKEKIKLKRKPHIFTSEEFKYKIFPMIIKTLIVIECMLPSVYLISQDFTQDHLKHLQIQFSQLYSLKNIFQRAIINFTSTNALYMLWNKYDYYLPKYQTQEHNVWLKTRLNQKKIIEEFYLLDKNKQKEYFILLLNQLKNKKTGNLRWIYEYNIPDYSKRSLYYWFGHTSYFAENNEDKFKKDFWNFLQNKSLKFFKNKEDFYNNFFYFLTEEKNKLLLFLNSWIKFIYIITSTEYEGIKKNIDYVYIKSKEERYNSTKKFIICSNDDRNIELFSTRKIKKYQHKGRDKGPCIEVFLNPIQDLINNKIKKYKNTRENDVRAFNLIEFYRSFYTKASFYDFMDISMSKKNLCIGLLTNVFCNKNSLNNNEIKTIFDKMYTSLINLVNSQNQPLFTVEGNIALRQEAVGTPLHYKLFTPINIDTNQSQLFTRSVDEEIKYNIKIKLLKYIFNNFQQYLLGIDNKSNYIKFKIHYGGMRIYHCHDDINLSNCDYLLIRLIFSLGNEVYKLLYENVYKVIKNL